MAEPVYIEQQLSQVLAKLDQLLARDGGSPGNPTPEPPQPPPPVPTTRKPAEVLDLRNWTVMLPTGSEGDPDNLYPAKAGVIPQVLYVDDSGAVVFETPADGVHSSGSKYPRTELRQMNDANWTKAAWPSTRASSLECELAFDLSGLSTRRRANAMQIHDGGDDVCQIMHREDGKLGLAHNDGASFEIIDPAYVNGTRFTAKIVVTGDGLLQVFYNGAKRVEVPKKGTGWYWKQGCYLQTGGASTFKEPAGARGRVKVWRYAMT